MLAEPLEALGAETVCSLPVIEIREPPNPSRSIMPSRISPSYDWLIFTSVNGVRFFVEAPGPLRARICGR